MLYNVRIRESKNVELIDDEDMLFADTVYHILDVENVMNMICSHLEDIGENHDYTKLKYFDEFKQDVLGRIEQPNFEEREWYNIHTKYERHHINSVEPEDVNLFDIMEMIVDCIVSGKSRNGEVKSDFLMLDDGILERAYWNTIKEISKYIKIKD